MFPFTSLGPFDHSEKKALLFAFLFCAVFIVLLSASAPAKRTRTKKLTVVSTAPLAKTYEPSESSFGDPIERFRFVPENFREVDFKNFSYGINAIYDGKPVGLTLTDGELWNSSGWYKLQDVYYKDVTGDGLEEAIVRISRTRCGGGSCDGGAAKFYIYSSRNGKLKNIWQYETGSYAYGCGLKTFILGNKQMIMELFGQCASQAMDRPGPEKFVVEDLTFLLFEFDGRRFRTKQIEFIPDLPHNVKNWVPDIQIY